ncbi:MAG TPA: LuxR C-terminal-related transcriptional regulator [Candidatus Limnocylindrales bacterium]|nr:LuxR C-terminal-related transcriptional regulator [Candidatus Limnocylindrales bacterium]
MTPPEEAEPVVAGLIGRATELDEVVRALRHDRPVVVAGEAGIGKTTLVRAAAAVAGRQLHEGGGFATLQALPYLAVRRAISQPVAGDPALVAGRVERAVGPDVLFIDDFQWADPATRDVVDLLIGRVAVVVAIREGDPGTDAALRAISARGATAVRLRGLASADALLLASRVHPDAGPARLRQLVERAGGNPLLIEELAAQGRTSTSLARAIVRQVERLGPGERRALELLVLAARPLPPGVVGPAGERLRGRGLVEAVSDGLAVRHDLIAAAIEEAIDPPRRRRLHRQLAALMDEPAERARHLEAAGRRAEAFDVAVAALAATRDPRTRAVLLGIAARTTDTEPSIWRVRAALEHRAIGNTSEAIALLDEPVVGDDGLKAFGAAILAGSLDHEGRGVEALAVLEAAHALRPDPTSDGAIELASVESVVLVNRGRLADGLAVAERVLREAGDTPRRYRLEGNVAALRLYAAATDRLEELEAALEATFAAGDGGIAAGRAMDLHYLTLALRGGAAAAAVAFEAAARVEALGYHTRATELRAESAQATIFAGELQATVVHVDSLLEEPLGLLSRQRLLYNRGLALGLLGRVEEAERTFEEVAGFATPDFDGQGCVLWCWGEVALWSGQARRALELAESSLTFTAFNDAEFVLPSLTRAWAEVEVGRAPSASPIRVQFRFLAGAPHELRGVAALAAGDHVGAATAFEEAASLWAGFHAERALICRWAAAESQRRAGDAGAVPLLRSALAGAVAIGFEPLAARVRRSLRLAGERPASAASTDRPGGLLTAREVEMVRLVERGLSNIEIARRLGLGRPTVARMLASAMGKLGVERRTQLAARELV